MPAAWLASLLGLLAARLGLRFVERQARGLAPWADLGVCPACRGRALWGGPCPDCGREAPALRWGAQAAFAALSFALARRGAARPETWAYLAFAWVLLTLALGDWRSGYLYDALTLPLLAAGLGMSAFFPGLLGGPWHSALSALAMGLGLAALRSLGSLLLGREALGWGDVKLMVGAAAFLGWPLAWAALLLGSLLGLPCFLLYRRLRGGAWGEPAPFGPALVLGCLIAVWDLLGPAPRLRAWLP